MTLYKWWMPFGELKFERKAGVTSVEDARVRAEVLGHGHYVVVQGEETPRDLEDPYIVGRVDVPEDQRDYITLVHSRKL